MFFKMSTLLNWLLTLGWLVVVGILWFFQSFDKPTTLNELGDFIAGAFAPLAFFWLVRGFYQQGKGLEQNSEALKLQANELEKSTEALELQVQEMKLALLQQTELTETTKQDLALSKTIFDYQSKIQHTNAQPFFHLQNMKVINHGYVELRLFIDYEFSNSRETCRELEIKIRDVTDGSRGGVILISPRYDLVKGNSEKTYAVMGHELNKTMQFSDRGTLGLEIIFSYLDATDSNQSTKFQIVIIDNKHRKNYEVQIHRPRPQHIIVGQKN